MFKGLEPLLSRGPDPEPPASRDTQPPPASWCPGPTAHLCLPPVTAATLSPSLVESWGQEHIPGRVSGWSTVVAVPGLADSTRARSRASGCGKEDVMELEMDSGVCTSVLSSASPLPPGGVHSFHQGAQNKGQLCLLKA